MVQLFKFFATQIPGNGNVYENDRDFSVFGDFKMAVKPSSASLS